MSERASMQFYTADISTFITERLQRAGNETIGPRLFLPQDFPRPSFVRLALAALLARSPGQHLFGDGSGIGLPLKEQHGVAALLLGGIHRHVGVLQ